MDDLVKRLRDKVEASRIYDDDEELLDEAADRIEKLEAANLKQSCIKVDDIKRIENLETALRHCINALRQYEMGDDRPRGPIPNDDLRPWLLGAMDNAIKTLEGKDE